jgi:hypothetical protein
MQGCQLVSYYNSALQGTNISLKWVIKVLGKKLSLKNLNYYIMWQVKIIYIIVRIDEQFMIY